VGLHNENALGEGVDFFVIDQDVRRSFGFFEVQLWAYERGILRLFMEWCILIGPG
jgi:hypothetical protein